MPTYAQLEAEPWWGREIVTPELRWLGTELCAAFGVPAVNWGAKGDRHHTRGAHRSQEWILNSRYCTSRTYTVQSGLSPEQARHIAGGDITPASKQQMLQICRNLDTVVRAGGLEEVREWYGNTDGDGRVDGWNNIENRVASSDDSHLWHLHMTLDRRVLRDMGVMRRIRSALLTGTTKEDDVGQLDGVQAEQLSNLERLRQALTSGDTHVRGVYVWTPQGGRYEDQPLGLVQRIAALEARLAELAARPVGSVTLTEADRVALAEALGEVLGPVALEAAAEAVRQVLGGLDGAVPPGSAQ